MVNETVKQCLLLNIKISNIGNLYVAATVFTDPQIVC